jgi:hypothetical protein
VSRCVALTTELAVPRKALYKEQAARSAVDRAWAEENAAREAIDQSLLSSNEANVVLARELESTQASLTTTFDKLSSKFSALDTVVMREQQMKIQLTACAKNPTVANNKLKAAKDKMKI